MDLEYITKEQCQHMLSCFAYDIKKYNPLINKDMQINAYITLYELNHKCIEYGNSTIINNRMNKQLSSNNRDISLSDCSYNLSSIVRYFFDMVTALTDSFLPESYQDLAQSYPVTSQDPKINNLYLHILNHSGYIENQKTQILLELQRDALELKQYSGKPSNNLPTSTNSMIKVFFHTRQNVQQGKEFYTSDDILKIFRQKLGLCKPFVSCDKLRPILTRMSQEDYETLFPLKFIVNPQEYHNDINNYFHKQQRVNVGQDSDCRFQSYDD